MIGYFIYIPFICLLLSLVSNTGIEFRTFKSRDWYAKYKMKWWYFGGAVFNPNCTKDLNKTKISSLCNDSPKTVVE